MSPCPEIGLELAYLLEANASRNRGTRDGWLGESHQILAVEGVGRSG